MKTYYITETQNANSIRYAEKITAKNLSSAKRQATKNQVYQGTVLKIYEDIVKYGCPMYLLSSKNTGFENTNHWIDERY